jgi:hypothetical protein
MTRYFLDCIFKSQYFAECDALTEHRDFWDIESRESVLAAYLADCNWPNQPTSVGFFFALDLVTESFMIVARW